VGAGISDWMTYYVNTDIHPFTRQYLKATPWDDPKIYADTSPMTYIKQAHTPTLIQHGDQDARVPIPNAFQLYQGLRDQNVPVQLSIFKGFGHGINKPKPIAPPCSRTSTGSRATSGTNQQGHNSRCARSSFSSRCSSRSPSTRRTGRRALLKRRASPISSSW
jgi:acetyl esterase/lipase